MTSRIDRRLRTSGARARILRALLVTTALASIVPTSANAASLPGKRFGPGIDPPANYQGQTRCDPHVKPGVASFRRIVMKAFPTTGAGYFTRACSVGGQSEHKDGRAWDWMVSASRAGDRRKVNKLFDWLLQRDGRGEKYARARRIGIMYMIWNRRIWFPWQGWGPYSGSSPHTDHVHFSFSWPGARKRTTFWKRHRSFVVDAASHPSRQGLWTVTGNAHVLTAGASSFEGDRSSTIGSGEVAGIAPTPTGDGYWVAKRSGKVLEYGDAPRRGSYRGRGAVVDIEPTPRGYGYWILTKSGRVAAFGNAQDFGNPNGDLRAAGIAATPNGEGYWIASKGGGVFEFGNARSLGRPEATNAIVADIEGASEQGYWLVARRGRVWAFGAAGFEGDLRGVNSAWAVSAISATPSGGGYWLVDEGGRAREFGNALRADVRHASTTATAAEPTTVPVDPAPDEHLFLRDFLRSRR